MNNTIAERGEEGLLNSAPFLQATLTGVVTGVLLRYLMLKRDFRQYPSYPHGTIIHLAMAFIAAVIGAVGVPAMMEKEFPAVGFLALAATQFREVRDLERTMLLNLDKENLVSRGTEYVEGIARVFEARNYLVMFTSFLVGGVTYQSNIFYGLLVAIAAYFISGKLKGGKIIDEIARVRPAEVRFEGPNLFVENIQFMNLGLEGVRQKYRERALGVIIEPLDDDARSTLGSVGQRMAIAHDAAAIMGIYKDVDTPEFTPVLRRDLDTGRVGMVIVPIEKDIESLLETVKRVPVLESAARAPLKTAAGRKAAD